LAHAWRAGQDVTTRPSSGLGGLAYAACGPLRTPPLNPVASDAAPRRGIGRLADVERGICTDELGSEAPAPIAVAPRRIREAASPALPPARSAGLVPGMLGGESLSTSLGAGGRVVRLRRRSLRSPPDPGARSARPFGNRPSAVLDPKPAIRARGGARSPRAESPIAVPRCGEVTTPAGPRGPFPHAPL